MSEELEKAKKRKGLPQEETRTMIAFILSMPRENARRVFYQELQEIDGSLSIDSFLESLHQHRFTVNRITLGYTQEQWSRIANKLYPS